MFDFIGDLISAGSSVIGSVASGIGDLVGGVFGGGDSGGGIFGLGLNILGGGGGFDSPILGHVLGAVGQQLLAPTAEERAEEAGAIMRAQREAEQAAIAGTYEGADLYTPPTATRPNPAERPKVEQPLRYNGLFQSPRRTMLASAY